MWARRSSAPPPILLLPLFLHLVFLASPCPASITVLESKGRSDLEISWGFYLLLSLAVQLLNHEAGWDPLNTMQEGDARSSNMKPEWPKTRFGWPKCGVLRKALRLEEKASFYVNEGRKHS
jgi:hypothetical protein